MWPYYSGEWVWVTYGQICSWSVYGRWYGHGMSLRLVGTLLAGRKWADGDGFRFSPFFVYGFAMALGRAYGWVCAWAGSGLQESLGQRRLAVGRSKRADNGREEKGLGIHLLSL